MIRLRPDELEALADFVREAKASHTYWKTVGALEKLFNFYWEHVNAYGSGGNPAQTTAVGNGFPPEGVVVKDRNPYPDPSLDRFYRL